MARLERIDVVSIAVRDLAKAQEFYTQALGLAEPKAMPGWLSLRVPDGARVALWVPDPHDAAQVRDADLIGTSTGIGFTTGNLREAMLALRRKGVRMTKADPTGQSPYGLHAVLEDPDGNGLMLFQPQGKASGKGTIDGLAFSNVVVQDLRLARGWYQDTLGLSPGEVRAEQGWAEMKAGAGPSLGLFQPMRPNYRDEADYEADLAHLGTRTGVSFVADDIAAWCKEAKQKGVRITAEPQLQAWGATVARFADPDGNEFAVAHAGGEARKPTRKSG